MCVCVCMCVCVYVQHAPWKSKGCSCSDEIAGLFSLSLSLSIYLPPSLTLLHTCKHSNTIHTRTDAYPFPRALSSGSPRTSGSCRGWWDSRSSRNPVDAASKTLKTLGANLFPVWSSGMTTRGGCVTELHLHLGNPAVGTNSSFSLSPVPVWRWFPEGPSGVSPGGAGTGYPAAGPGTFDIIWHHDNYVSISVTVWFN